MKVLITGGAGFIGSFLCDRELGKGNEVICLDSLYSGFKENIRHLLEHPRFSFVLADVCEADHLEFDRVYHFACPASPITYQRDPVHTWKTGTLGTCRLLEMAERNRARFMLASTSEVYGNPLVHPQPETYHGNVNPIGPRSCYDESKRAAETLCMDFARHRGLDLKIIRIFNTYGPRMAADDGRVVSNFITQALAGEDITIYGNGNQTRSFCYVSDLVEGISRTMDSENFRGPVNLGNPGEFTVLELAELVIEILGSRSKPKFSELPVDDPEKRKPDIGLAKKILGWEPLIPLREGIAKTAEYFSGRTP